MTERNVAICVLVALPGLMALASSIGLLLFIAGLESRDYTRWWLQYRRQSDS